MLAVLIRNVMVVLVLAMLAREFCLFVWRYAAVLRLFHAQRYREAQPAMEALAAAPSVFGAWLKTDIYYRLAWVYMNAGRYEEAAEQCRKMLRPYLPLGVRSRARERLADCLDGLGRTAEAAAEREVAGSTDRAGGSRVDAVLARARSLDAQRRFPEACAAYEEALSRCEGDASRAEDMVRFALCLFNAGRAEETVQWAERAIALGLPPHLRSNAYSIAALGCSNLGQLDACEEHRRRAVVEAVKTGSADRVAECMAQLAMTLRLRGSIVEAIQMCEKAAAMSTTARRNARFTQSDCLRLWGRFDEARDMLNDARATPPLATPRMEHVSQANLRMALSWVEADAGHLAEARSHMEAAAEAFRADEKLSVCWEATAAWLLALEGSETEARAQHDRVVGMLASRDWDRSTKLAGCGLLAAGCAVLADHAAAERWWRRYLESEPPPCDQPEAWYGLGMSLHGLEQHEAAREAFERAVAVGIDTRFTRLAAKRLSTSGNT